MLEEWAHSVPSVSEVSWKIGTELALKTHMFSQHQLINWKKVHSMFIADILEPLIDFVMESVLPKWTCTIWSANSVKLPCRFLKLGESWLFHTHHIYSSLLLDYETHNQKLKSWDSTSKRKKNLQKLPVVVLLFLWRLLLYEGQVLYVWSFLHSSSCKIS